MNIEYFREYCMAKPGVTEGFPFDNNTLVFKVMGKMFALVDVDMFESINLKCEPSKALELREKYPEVAAGYHMNKMHWNTVQTGGNLTDELLKEWIDHSYDLVVQKLPEKLKNELNQDG